MARFFVLLVVTLIESTRVVSQTAGGATAKPAFDVVSVKLNTSGDFGGSFGTEAGGNLVVRNNTLRNIIRNAYQVQNYQIVGGPAWLDNARFDITAKPPSANPPLVQFRAMVQAMLADRFKLVVRRETREMPVYTLVLARPDGRLGARLKRSASDCAAIAEAARRGAPPPTRPDGGPTCGTRTMPGRIIANGVGMEALARNLSNFAGRLTVDKTGLAGGFDLDLEYTPEQMPPDGVLPPGLPRPPADGPSLFTAVQEQLGLRLDSQRQPAEVLVIERAEMPTPD